MAHWEARLALLLLYIAGSNPIKISVIGSLGALFVLRNEIVFPACIGIHFFLHHISIYFYLLMFARELHCEFVLL